MQLCAGEGAAIRDLVSRSMQLPLPAVQYCSQPSFGKNPIYIFGFCDWCIWYLEWYFWYLGWYFGWGIYNSRSQLFNMVANHLLGITQNVIVAYGIMVVWMVYLNTFFWEYPNLNLASPLEVPCLIHHSVLEAGILSYQSYQ